MSKETLYNVYRPSSFDQVVGQDSVVLTIKSLLEQNKLPHSLILFGPSGTGKTTVARLIANHYNQHPSGFIEINGSKDRGIEAIREVTQSMYYSPIQGDYKVYFFDEAHMITKDAFEALLKSVEEPPEHVKFIFATTDISKIPRTIEGRSQRYYFKKISDSLIRGRLKEILVSEKKEISDESMTCAIQMADGSLRDAILALSEIIGIQDGEVEVDIAEVLGILSEQKISKVLYNDLVRNYSGLMESIAAFHEGQVNPFKALWDFQQFLMDSVYYLRCGEQICDSLKFDVSKFVTEVCSLVEANSGDVNQMKSFMLKRFLHVYSKSVLLEQTLQRTKNHKSAFESFVVELAGSW